MVATEKRKYDKDFERWNVIVVEKVRVDVHADGGLVFIFRKRAHQSYTLGLTKHMHTHTHIHTHIHT